MSKEDKQIKLDRDHFITTFCAVYMASRAATFDLASPDLAATALRFAQAAWGAMERELG